MSLGGVVRDWQPGDGLRCSASSRSPVACGQPVKTQEKVVTGVNQSPRVVRRPLCALHAAVDLADTSVGQLRADAEKAAHQRLASENWAEFQRYTQEFLDAAVATVQSRSSVERPTR